MTPSSPLNTARKHIHLIHDFGAASLYEGQMHYQASSIDYLELSTFCGDIQPHNIDQTRYVIHSAARYGSQNDLFLCGISYLSDNISSENHSFYLLKTKKGAYIGVFNVYLYDFLIRNESSLIESLSSASFLSDKDNSGHFAILDLLKNINDLSLQSLDIPKLTNDKPSTSQMIFDDCFGNIITDYYLSQNTPKKVVLRDRYEVGYVDKPQVTPHLSPIAYKNTDGYLEIALSGASASKEFNMRNKQDVKIIY